MSFNTFIMRAIWNVIGVFCNLVAVTSKEEEVIIEVKTSDMDQLFQEILDLNLRFKLEHEQKDHPTPCGCKLVHIHVTRNENKAVITASLRPNI